MPFLLMRENNIRSSHTAPCMIGIQLTHAGLSPLKSRRGTYSLTVVTYRRIPILTEEGIYGIDWNGGEIKMVRQPLSQKSLGGATIAGRTLLSTFFISRLLS